MGSKLRLHNIQGLGNVLTVFPGRWCPEMSVSFVASEHSSIVILVILILLPEDMTFTYNLSHSGYLTTLICQR